MTTFLKKETISAVERLTSAKLAIDDMSLTVVKGPHKGQELRIEQELVRIGRAEWCDLSLPDDQWASKVHCECWLNEKGLRVRDLDSSNGIKIQGVHVRDAFLMAGETLQVGQSTLKLRSHKQKREIDIQYRDPSGILVGKSMEMRKIFSMLPRLAERNVPTLLTGETGTGKTTIANAIHRLSGNADAPFVVVNCGALPPNLIESSLFGHIKGAYTGADQARIGFFEQAQGGTLFLDEIAELPFNLQPKLLDVIERRMIRPVGSETERRVDFRLLTATHRDLRKDIEEGRFREDLFFRISVFELNVPSLRERQEDIPLLSEVMLRDLRPDMQYTITSQAQRLLTDHLWPGNIRELRNVLERTIMFLDGDTIEASTLVLSSEKAKANQSNQLVAPAPTLPEFVPPSPPELADSSAEAKFSVEEIMPVFPLTEHDPPLSIKEILVEAERTLIKQAMLETDNYVPDAAKLLNVSESWIYNRIKRYGFASRRKE